MRKVLLLLCSALAWAQTAPPASPAASAADPVVLTVGTQTLTKSWFEAIINTLPDQQQEQVKAPEGRRKMAEQLSELLTLAQEAKARKLDVDKDVITRVMLQTDQVLANAAFQALGTADDATLRAYYDAHKADMAELHARHILIRFKGSRVPLRPGTKDLSEDEALAKAKEVRAKLIAGAKFEDVAKAESDDTGSGEAGGDLDTFTKGTMTPLFEEAAFALPVGEISEPVKTEFGYHLIKVESKKTKTFEDAKADIIDQIGPEQAKKGLEGLKAKTKVTFDEGYFGKEAPPAAPAAAPAKD